MGSLNNTIKSQELALKKLQDELAKSNAELLEKTKVAVERERENVALRTKVAELERGLAHKEEGEEEGDKEYEYRFDESEGSEEKQEQEEEGKEDLVEVPASTLRGTATPLVLGSERHVTRD